MPIVFHILSVSILTIGQITLLSYLPIPFSDISFPLLAIAIAIFVNRPVEGAIWALFGGITLDLHGIYPFGTELFVMLSVFYLTRLLFRRFITNASLVAVFLLSMVVISLHAIMILGFDGIRVIFGSTPFIVGQNTEVGIILLRMIIINGLLSVALIALSRRVKERFIQRFVVKK